MGNNSQCTKSTKQHKWTQGDIDRLHDIGRLSAKECARQLGVTKRAVDEARYRFGRFGAPEDKVCCICRERPVWVESESARRLQLCSGCYEREMLLRRQEQPLHNARRQREWHEKHRKGGK